MKRLCTALILLWAPLVGCTDPVPRHVEPVRSSAPMYESDVDVGGPVQQPVNRDVLGDELCADCHPDEVDAWRASPMGQSLTTIQPSLVEQLGSETIQHPNTAEHFSVARRGDALHQSSAGIGYAAQWVIGSGAHTRSFLHRADGRYFVLPLTWYRQRRGWELSPGYEVSGHPGFHRQAGAECLNCHSDPPDNQAGSQNRFIDGEPRAIGCGRCHAGSQMHARQQASGQRTPIPFHDGMAPERAADVCNYCHMQGVVRVLRPGRNWSDFKPGMALSDVVAVFARKTPGQSITIANQAERLGRSRCVEKDSRARQCTTCHSPHSEKPDDRNHGCRGCHEQGAGTCNEKHDGDCASCHMARTATSDIPHVQMTDHFIRRRPLSKTLSAGDAGELVWLNEPIEVKPIEQAVMRARALAELARQTGLRPDLMAALESLQMAIGVQSTDVDVWLDLASIHVLLGKVKAARDAADKAWAIDPDLGRVAMGVAEARFAAGDIKGTAEALKRGIDIEGQTVESSMLAAKRAMVSGDTQTFDERLRAVDGARPHRGMASNLRGIAALTRGQWPDAINHFSEATRREPGNPQFWLNLCRMYLRRGQNTEAKTACTRGQSVATEQDKPNFGGAMARILLNAGDAGRAAQLAAPLVKTHSSDVLLVLGRLALDRGRINDAVLLLDRAVTAEPTGGRAWLYLSRALSRQGKADLARASLEQAKRYGAIDKAARSK